MGYYDKRNTNNTFHYSTSNVSEPNMRNEMDNTIDGSFPEIAKGHPVILRKARLDSNGDPISCPCVDSLTYEADKDSYCPICRSMGFYFDEEWIDVYSTYELSTDASLASLNQIAKAGILNIPSVVFYTKYNDQITNNDRIVHVSLNNDGTVSEPVTRTQVYRVNFVWNYRSDNGKLEYNKIFTHKEIVKYLNEPDWDGE